MCWNITVLHLCHDYCSCFLEKYCSQIMLSSPSLCDDWTFKRVLVIEHNARENFRETCFKNNLITLEFSFFASPAAGKTAIEIVHFTTFVERATIEIIKRTEFSLAASHKAWHRSIFILCVCARVCVCVFLVRVSDKYAIHWVRLCPRSWTLILRTECTVFPNTNRPRLAKNSMFFLKLNEMFSKRTVMI